MKAYLVLIALLLGGILLPATGPAAADGVKTSDVKPLAVKPWRYNDHGPDLPFPRGYQAQSVWAAGACWSECGSYCAWGIAACLAKDAQGQCIKLGDKCDRYCQRQCRSLGGPALPIDFFWD